MQYTRMHPITSPKPQNSEFQNMIFPPSVLDKGQWTRMTGSSSSSLHPGGVWEEAGQLWVGGWAGEGPTLH